MTIYKFNKLAPQQKLAALELQSILVGSREENEFHIALLQISGFFVEAYYLNHSRKVSRLQSFKSTHKLKPYFENRDNKINF